MIKKTLSLIYAVFMCCALIAQEFKIESSEAFDKLHKNEVTKIAFASAYGFSTYSYLENVFLDNQKEITITKYDQNLKRFGTIHFNLPKLNLRAAELNTVLEVNNEQLIFISNSMSKNKGIREVYAQVYDLKSNSVSDHKIIASYPIASYSKSGQIEVSYSEDKSKIVVLANLPFVKKTNEKIKIWTFNSNLETLWSSEHNLNLTAERAHNQDVHISNNGNVYVVKRHKYNSKKATSSLITINGENKTEKLISSPSFFTRKTSLINIGLEDLIFGYYYEGKVPNIDHNSDKGNATTGLFLYSIASNKFLGKHKFDSKNPNTKNLASLNTIFTYTLGEDLFIVSEKQTYSSKFKSDKSTDLDYLYTHGPTIVINLDINGTLKDISYITNSKTYKNEQNERASVAVLPLNGGLKLMYNQSTFRMSSFYNEDKTTYNNLPTKYNQSQSVSTSYMTPKSFKSVKDYNIAYFAASNGNKLWLNKMSW